MIPAIVGNRAVLPATADSGNRRIIGGLVVDERQKVSRSVSPTTASSMFLPRLRTAAIVAAAAGGPYVATQTEWGRGAVSSLTETIQSSDTYYASTANYSSHSHYEVEALRQRDPSRYRYDEPMARKLGGGTSSDPEAAPTLVGTRVNDLREVMRFDISPNWVTQRFSRVTTVLADLKLEGLRVPIVTGTQVDDLAGTLTYYFDGGGKLQRVTIHGFTGDPNRLVGAMTKHYGLTREPALEAGVYTTRWNGLPVHFLRLTHASVIYSDALHQKYTVFLELNQPNLAYGISHEARRIVQSDRASGRW
jgi:hypothetical protein